MCSTYLAGVRFAVEGSPSTNLKKVKSTFTPCRINLISSSQDASSLTCEGWDGAGGLVRRLCDGKSRCEVDVSLEDFQSHCKNVDKYLEVTYECVKKGEGIRNYLII